MAITQEVVEERLRELHEQRAQALATLNACEGAIQDCEFWLAQLDKEVPDEGSDTTPVL